MILTIFTPTYNRACTLPTLYQSLQNQSSRDFVWLIVDDGSTDDTKNLVSGWIGDSHFDIQYFHQNNMGKAMAHNKGVEMTNTELFTCVDSDDYLADDAVEKILKAWKSVSSNCIGLLAYMSYPDGRALTRIGKPFRTATLYDACRKYRLTGDTMLIFRTETIKKYRFPYFEGEKFVPEVYLYDQLDAEGVLTLLPEALYVCEYLDDGYTYNMAKVIVNNPEGYIAWIRQRLSLKKSCREKFINSIKYNAICISARKRSFIRNAVYPFYSFLVLLPGWLFYFKRYRKYRENR